jgi:hypothetical protein
MKYTLYGLIISISTLIAFSFINNITTIHHLLITAIVIISIFLQPLFCHSCLTSYSLAAYLATIPLLIALIFDCSKIHMFITAFAIATAIGRIACFFAGCCSGKVDTHHSPFSILYTKGTVIADHLHHDVHVFPTILIEIFFEFFIAFLLLFSKYGLLLYGPINLLLLFFSSYWRFTPRIGYNLYIPILSLALFSFIIHFKSCYTLTQVQFVFKPFSLFFAILFGLIVSNDIHIQDIFSIF